MLNVLDSVIVKDTNWSITYFLYYAYKKICKNICIIYFYSYFHTKVLFCQKITFHS